MVTAWPFLQKTHCNPFYAQHLEGIFQNCKSDCVTHWLNTSAACHYTQKKIQVPHNGLHGHAWCGSSYLTNLSCFFFPTIFQHSLSQSLQEVSFLPRLSFTSLYGNTALSHLHNCFVLIFDVSDFILPPFREAFFRSNFRWLPPPQFSPTQHLVCVLCGI